MATVDLTSDTLEKTLAENDIVLIDWWAAWCGPCRMFAPTYAKVSEKNPDIVFGKIDTEAEQALSSAAGIMSIPTLMAFREGVLVFGQPGALPESALERLIENIRELDMPAIHAQVAEAAQAQS